MIRAAMGERQNQRNLMITNYSKRKLLSYADSLKELANCFAGDYVTFEEQRESALERKQMWDNKEVLSDNLKELASVLTRTATEVFSINAFPLKEYKKVVQALKWERIYVKDLYTLEGNATSRVRPFMFNLSMYTSRPGGMEAEEVADLLSVLMDRRLTLSITSPSYVDATIRSYVFVEESKFYMMHGMARAIKEEEEASGDHYLVVESEQGIISAMLSDGMGSGQKADRDSNLVVDMMERLLEAGFPPATAIRLVNNSMLAMNEGLSMSTLDLCTLDLYSGVCEFRKVGAATTFIKNNIYVEPINSYSLPLGAVSIKGDEMIRRELMDQDYIIMVTDGVLDALGEEGAESKLIDYLDKLQEKDPNQIAKGILEYVLRCSKGRVKDDMMILVLGIFLNR